MTTRIFMISLLNTIKFIIKHPLNRHRPLSAFSVFMRWQIGSRLLPGAVIVPFVKNTRLLVKPGMTGATGNVYCGLHEFADMGLVLHALRPDDLFIDVGANIGSYSVLAAGVCGASVIAVEPIPSTFEHFRDNIRINNLEPLVTAKNIGLASCPGNLFFSKEMDTENHVLTNKEMTSSSGVSVSVHTLDTLTHGFAPTLIKIDVEGYEMEVLKGGKNSLQKESLLAVIMELNGSGKRYGFDDEDVNKQMIKSGFTPYFYDPFTRTLMQQSSRPLSSGNQLFVRNIQSLATRVKYAPQCTINGKIL